MEETFEQKIIRNVKAGGFAVYKTPQVVGNKTMLANIEWEDPEEVDKFFAFARSLGAKIIYVSESEDEPDETSAQPKMSIVQIGFLYDSVMHHINLLEDEEEEDDEESEDEEGEEYEDDEESEEDEYEEPPARPVAPQSYQQPPQAVPQQQMNSSQGQPQQGTPQPSQGWPRPQF